MTDLTQSIENYYRNLGNGDPLTGARLAKKTLAIEFFDSIINNMTLESELREKAFFAKANYEFAGKYEKIVSNHPVENEK